MNQDLKCSFCEKVIKNKGALSCHEPYCKLNPDRIKRKVSPDAHAPKGIIPWSKGLTKKEDSRICSAWNKGLKGSTSGKASTEEKEILRKLKISEKAKLNNGGYRQGSGRGKKGWYKGIFCDSSWELAFLVYHVDMNIPIERCKEQRIYTFNGKSKKYYPDFLVNSSQIFEIKGYVTKEWLAKFSENKDIFVLYEDDMKKYIDYAIEKHGKDYIKLYEMEATRQDEETVLKTAGV